MDYRSFNDSWFGFVSNGIIQLIVTAVGVYIAFRWEGNRKKKEEIEKHQRFLHSVYFQTKFRQQKIFQILTDIFKSNRLETMTQGQLASLTNFLPPQEQISEALKDLEVVQYFSGLRDQLEWGYHEKIVKSNFADLYMMGLMLQKLEFSLINFLKYESTRQLWDETASLYCQLPYLILNKFGVTIDADYQLRPEMVSANQDAQPGEDDLTKAVGVCLELSNLIDGKENIDWELSEKEKYRIFVSLYEFGVSIKGYNKPEMHEAMKEILAKKMPTAIKQDGFAFRPSLE